MEKIRNYLPKNAGLLVTFLLLILLPVTVYSTLKAEPASPLADICYDFDGDGIVNIKDVDLVVALFGKERGDLGFNEKYDFDYDGAITGGDINTMVYHIGETCPPS